jgi:hypothetical protein
MTVALGLGESAVDVPQQRADHVRRFAAAVRR